MKFITLSVITLLTSISSFAASPEALLAVARTARNIETFRDEIRPKITEVTVSQTGQNIHVDLTYTYSQEIAEGDQWEGPLQWYDVKKKCDLMEAYENKSEKLELQATDYICETVSTTPLKF